MMTNYIDPVCGMMVKPETAAGTQQYGGKTYYFCSSGCQQKFASNPEIYVNRQEQPQVAESHSGHLERNPHPIHSATLPKPSPSQTVEYTCPMHPEIVRNKPGSCPICGMALEPRTVTLEAEDNRELKD